MNNTKADNRSKWQLQCKIANRAEQEFGKMDRMSLIMDLDSVPDLDLEALLAASWQDFAHDIGGIMQYMDRSSYPGKLTQCFVPRCSKKYSKKAGVQ